MREMGIGPEWLEKSGITMVVLPYLKVTSTSSILNAYAAEDEDVRIIDTTTTTCKTCGRAVYKTDVDENGNCIEHSGVWHKPTEEEWKDLGRPA